MSPTPSAAASMTRSDERPRARETRAKAAGEALFVLDRLPQDILYARLLRARGPHAKVRIDRALLASMPGVLAVLGPEEDPGVPHTANPHGGREDMAVFTAEARFAGDVVGAVVARSRAEARAAVAAAGAVVEEPLPAVLDVRAARANGAPPAHREFADSGNLLAELAFGTDEDDVARALAASEHVFDETYRTDATAHAFLEPLASAAEFGPDGTCRVWSNTQCPVLSRDILARILGVAPNDLRYEPVAIGGSFGGKEEFLLDAVAGLCSRAVDGRAVVVETDRKELTAMFRLRHPFSVRVTTGCDATGRITARRIHAVSEGGPYALHSPAVLANGLTLALSMYPVDMARATGECVALNRTPGGAYRGYGAPQVVFAVESQLNEMSDALGIDPVALRRLNSLRPGDIDPVHGWRAESYNVLRCLAEVEALPPLERRTDHPRLRRGRGIACLANVSGVTGAAGVDEARARCSVRAGRIVVTTACPDVGQGLHSLLATVAAQETGVPTALVDVEFDAHGQDRGIYASRGTYLSANAAALAARQLKAGLPSHTLAPDAAALPPLWDGHTAEATFRAPDNALVAGVQVADVEVDTDTGQIKVLKVTSVHDVGRLMQPDAAREQVIGGVVQGLGSTLTETLPFDGDGAAYDATLLGLGVPGAAWPVEVDAVFPEEPHHPVGPLGAKGLGESPLIGIAAAVSAAVHDAVGVRLRHTPFTPERTWRALRDHQHEDAQACDRAQRGMTAMAAQRRKPFGLVVHGNPFGWGSMGKICHVLDRLPEARSVLLGKSLGHEIIREGVLEGSYPGVEDLGGPEAAQIVARHDIDVALVANDPEGADRLASLGIPVVFMDSLPFLWTAADPMPAKAAAYCAQRALELPTAAREALRRVEPVDWVGAILPAPTTTVDHDPRRIVINVGGLESPFGRNLGDSYLRAVLPPLLDALAQQHADADIHLCGKVSWEALKALGISTDRLTSVGIRTADEFDRLVAGCGLAVTSPGLTTLLQLQHHGMPVVTLPPQNVSQVLNARAFWTGQPQSCHMDWPQGVIDWARFWDLRDQGEEVTVRYMYERIRAAADDVSLHPLLGSEAHTAVRSGSSGAPQPLLLELLGTDGAAEVADVIRAQAAARDRSVR
ncbi:molybdopterin cofactor-binding domain-containing protein [Streptomyces sp. NPDC048710]|uniref:molybdopterin cofactor-binding domain-containing protein n=1 Tax=unclassified Streptomyces TaxID=2593676 RepID=UPI003720D7CA